MFFEHYIMHRLGLRVAWANLKAFFAPDDDLAQLDAVNATIERLEREKEIVCDNLRELRWEKTTLEKKLNDKKTSLA